MSKVPPISAQVPTAPMSDMLRGAAFSALVVISIMVWAIYRTVERAQDSNQWVVHTQEVLTAIDGPLSTVVDAESSVRRYLSSADPQDLEPLARADRTIDADINRLATLTLDSATQQANVRQLRQDAGRALGTLRTRAEATRESRAFSPSDADAQQAAVDAVRATMRAMRAQENQLLLPFYSVNCWTHSCRLSARSVTYRLVVCVDGVLWWSPVGESVLFPNGREFSRVTSARRGR